MIGIYSCNIVGSAYGCVIELTLLNYNSRKIISILSFTCTHVITEDIPKRMYIIAKLVDSESRNQRGTAMEDTRERYFNIHLSSSTTTEFRRDSRIFLSLCGECNPHGNPASSCLSHPRAFILFLLQIYIRDSCATLPRCIVIAFRLVRYALVRTRRKFHRGRGECVSGLSPPVHSPLFRFFTSRVVSSLAIMTRSAFPFADPISFRDHAWNASRRRRRRRRQDAFIRVHFSTRRAGWWRIVPGSFVKSCGTNFSLPCIHAIPPSRFIRNNVDARIGAIFDLCDRCPDCRLFLPVTIRVNQTRCVIQHILCGIKRV